MNAFRNTLHAACMALLTLESGLAAIGQTSGPARYTLSGTLLSSADGAVVRHARVSATPVDRGYGTANPPGIVFASSDTDADGRFAIDLPAAGAWRVTASARGFATEAYQQHGVYSTAVAVSPERPDVTLRFALHPASRIAGFVRDEQGEPIRQAEVTLMEVGFQEPGAILLSVTQRTDDRGAFLFGGLRAGRYRLLARAEPWYAVAARTSQAVRSGSSLDVVYRAMWYPGVADENLAQTLSLQVGESKDADIQMLAVPSIHVRIAPAGDNGHRDRRTGEVTAVVHPVGPDTAANLDGSAALHVSTQTDEHGIIDIGGLAPGEYRIGIAGAGQPAISTQIKVTDDPATTVPAAPDKGDPRLSAYMGRLYTERQERQERRQLTSSQTGSFDPALRGSATLMGTATRTGAPSAGATVVLVPISLEATGAPNVLRCDQTDTSGRLYLPGIEPGKYILIAVEQGWTINWSDALTLRQYLLDGIALDLKAGMRVEVNVSAQLP